MEVKYDKNLIQESLKQAIANVSLEEDFFWILDLATLKELEDKILKMGDNDEKLGGLFNTGDKYYKK